MSKNTQTSATQTRGSRTLYNLQVRAFLHAAEDIEVDAEIVADILDGFEDMSFLDDNASDDENLDDDDIDTLDISALYDSESKKELDHVWTKQEIRYMLNHLKERGMQSFVTQYVLVREIPIPKLLAAFGVVLCPELRSKKSKTLLYFLKVALSRELRLRDKLPQYNTLLDAILLIRKAKRIVVLTGAGISVSCGIPDFRSRDGVYATLKERWEWELDDPQQMFDINFFKENPAVFYSFAREIYPTNYTPSACHRFIKLLENKDKLLRNYTQNIDTLETLAGVERVLQCHGSFARATCLCCERNVQGKEIEKEILMGEVPVCSVCDSVHKALRKSKQNQNKRNIKGKRRQGEGDSESDDEPEFPPWVMKPDITFFGEKLTSAFDDALLADRETVDLLLVIGTSLKVAPVSDILSHLPHSVPQILINKTPVHHINPDIVLLGDADEIVLRLCLELGWELPPAITAANMTGQLQVGKVNPKKRPSMESIGEEAPKRVGKSHVWLFKGADGGKWLREMEKAYETQNDDATCSSDTNQAKRVKVNK